MAIRLVELIDKPINLSMNGTSMCQRISKEVSVRQDRDWASKSDDEFIAPGGATPKEP
jgi:hypothetical protein